VRSKNARKNYLAKVTSGRFLCRGRLSVVKKKGEMLTRNFRRQIYVNSKNVNVDIIVGKV
jgi:hypothetical protein